MPSWRLRRERKKKMKQSDKPKETPKKQLKFRNRKPNEEKRTARVTISLKPSEKTSLAGTAKEHKMSLGDLLYYIITDRPVKVLVPEHTEALRLIATMSNNINQLAHDANAAMMFGQYIPEQTINALNKALADLDKLLTNKSNAYGEV